MLKLSFKQQVLTGFTVSLIFVFIAALSSFLSITSLIENSNWVNHSNEIINTAQKTELELLNAESSLRGYLISGENEYYRNYTKNSNQVLPYIADLKKLASDNPSQLKIIDSLEDYANLKLEEMKTIIRKRRDSGNAAISYSNLLDQSENYKQRYLNTSENFINGELKLLKERKESTEKKSKQTILVILLSSIIIFGLILFLLKYIRTTFTNQKENEFQILKANADLEQISEQNAHNNWLLSGAAEINEAMRGQQDVKQLANNIITKISNFIEAGIGSLFIKDEYKDQLFLAGAFAYDKFNKKTIAFGEGLIGQVAVEKQAKLFKNVPKDYIKINSSFGEASPNFIYLVPVVFENEILAVAEFGFINEPSDKKLHLIDTMSENIGIAISSALAHLQLQQLFEQTQQQAEELSSQQEELRTTNEELMHKTEALQASEEELRVQQEELQQANTELEEKAQQLEERNISINQAKEAISLKAEELEISSKYKSEFLANMSHELRTPLNSILILARILKDNRPENLTDDQIKYAGVIYNAGSDLLTLINDILDLSKIESGNVDLNIETVRPLAIKQNIEALFTEVANNKKINFVINIKQELPKNFITDQVRLEQIIKNLLANAFKFTPEHGAITLEIGLAKNENVKTNKSLKEDQNQPLYFAVKDSGIGISKDKLNVIFEAFQQEDGSTSRKYGGTGLGLSICKELASILGGEIQLESELGIGSTFTLLIPQNLNNKTLIETEHEVIEEKIIPEKIENYLAPISTENRAENILLIIEDDEVFADVLKDYAIEKGFTPILAHSGDTGLAKAIEIIPDAIVLDIMLPVMDGWAVLKKLKANPITSHIPVHMMSAGNERTLKAEKEGAIGFLKKPIDKDKLDQAFDLLMKQNEYVFNKVLIIEDQILQSNTLTEQLIEKGAKVYQAYTGKEALEILEDQSFDCIILDLKLPDISGFDLLDQIKALPDLTHIPVIINTAMELDQEKMAHIMKYSEAMVLKSSKSNDRLLDEVSLFMNKLQNHQPESNQSYANTGKKTKQVSTQEKALKDKTILITDDDMRNIFALSSALQAYEVKIVIANNGFEALEKLKENTEIDLVLMDIMMPEMDGYEAMKQIRLQKKFAKLPIIALTAKAMKNDREKCLDAGANDYISKPVDVDKLLSLLRVWLS